ncbi:RNA polymerase factor sigma-54 [Acinetobacter nectaris]|uniref:RNA polymerase factor sigma-54 n=1 Tax=Acinetobacter nectaris TaxID=1219382 RepID=UPI001F01F614|nr:RNA polymerase factor sigma-54 [Acinetobacter nectaris]MCF9000047.1 RNA polymerase factor sigma-54 [Acinetobacter nectaris]MCF9028493.1 RNA polymerase factor sigma-54 [Acinetobacter nectaris]
MKLSLGLKVANSLSLTPQLQQAIRLLQLSNLELEQEVQLQLDSNPLLEAVDTASEENTTLEKQEVDLSEQLKVTDIPEDLPVDTQWDDIYTHQPTALGIADLDEREGQYSKEITLQQYLQNQINLLNFSKLDKLIAICIVDALDEKGFLIAEISEIKEAVLGLLENISFNEEDIDDEEIFVVLKHIQQLDPIGVGSRNLVECLSIQLKSLSDSVQYKSEALKVLSSYQFLITNDVQKLLKATGLKLPELKETLNLIKTLKPYPGSGFIEGETEYQIPDVVVLKKNDVWKVGLNPDVAPKLKVNSYYASFIKRADQSEDNQYLKNQLLEAKNFIKSIDERHKTLLKVATCIVKYQRDFLEYGEEAMKPLILRDVAEEVELHESTVSRVTTNKYILTPKGLFELKYFFSSHVSTMTGGECSSTAIRARIKKLISAESPQKPLSDNSIANLLKEEGIDVARRTVAKYRESLHIPSSSERKVLL